uniref:Bromo domain-containing protein n=1 Tax=Haptolina brevifila TaxID=156173 RepID=A0A7S2GYZ2_9EUKA|mmetsp:Transcript_49255/g.98186  ORF Transcript_49255/g.98186 Transcript_49255/m.98186 type:complete len:308 (+) Transcript_49255:47-970(+)
MHSKLSAILKSLKRSPKAQAFNQPVEGVPGYEFVVLDPMDLGTVEKWFDQDRRLPWAEKKYLMAEDFAHDVRLVFKNCFICNAAPTHYLFKNAKDLLTRFEELYAEELQQAEKRGPRCPLDVRCQMLLTDLRRNPLTEWFRRSQDWQAFGEQYTENIKSGEPMDLDEVQKKLDRGSYLTDGNFDDEAAVAFGSDVGLVWRNAMDFNKDNRGELTNFGVIAKLLQQSFERRLRHVRNAPRPASSAKLPKAASKRLRELRDTCSALPLTDAAVMVGLTQHDTIGSYNAAMLVAADTSLCTGYPTPTRTS